MNHGRNDLTMVVFSATMECRGNVFRTLSSESPGNTTSILSPQNWRNPNAYNQTDKKQ